MFKCAIGLAVAMLLLAAGCSDSSKGLSSPDSGERARALRKMVAAGDDKAAAQVAPLVKHEDTRTASQAIEALGRMSSSRACDYLRDVMTSEQRPALRKAAAASLAQRREPRAAETLRQAVVGDPAPEVRGEAALALVRAGNVEDVNVLANAAVAEPDPQAARCQVTAMGAILGVRLPYDPAATPEARKANLERIRATAAQLAQEQKGRQPPDFRCKHTPSG